jgi:hypothetical protein
MKFPRLVLALFGALTLSAASSAVSEPRLISGTYRIRWEEQSFTPCGSRVAWWVADPGDLAAHWRDHVEGDYGEVFATVRADVTDEGMFGHMGMYRRSMAVREVVDVRAARDGGCGEAGRRAAD